MSAGLSQQLAGWVADLTYEQLPAQVTNHIKYCLLDAIGCGLFGATQPWGQIAARAAVETTGPGKAALFAGGGCGSPAEAALANGTAVHGFEMDDVHVASSLHPGAVVIPAALAAATARPLSGRELMTALVAGYEAGIRVGICAGVRHSTSGYHVTGTVGTVAAGMAAARVLGLDAEATLHALGIAATQAAGLYAARVNSMTKRLHAGLAARAGVTGALLAQRGFTGSKEVLEASFGGFFSTLNGEYPPETVLDKLGEEWETARVGFKAYASCASSHTIIDALDQLMANGLSAANLKHLDVSMSRKGALNVGWTYAPGSVVSAQMNAQYVAAVKLLEGQVFVRQFREELLADPRVLDIVGRVSVHNDPEIDALGAARRHSVRVKATTHGGEVLTAYVEQRKGSAERPLSAQEIADKYRSVGATALAVNHEKLQEIVMALDSLPDATTALASELLNAAPQGR